MRLVIVLALLTVTAAAPKPPGTTGRPLEFTVTPAAAGRQLVRLSLPFPPGVVSEGQGLVVSDGQHETAAAVRVLTWHPGADPKTPPAPPCPGHVPLYLRGPQAGLVSRPADFR